MSEGIARREAVCLESGNFLADHLTQPLGRLEVVPPKYLLHPGIGDEGASAVAIEVLELAHVLQDRPELKPVACHQPHSALYGLQTARAGNAWTQEEGRPQYVGFEVPFRSERVSAG